MEEKPVEEKAVRVNATQDAKGFFKIEATARADLASEAAGLLVDAIKATREKMTAEGMKFLVDPA